MIKRFAVLYAVFLAVIVFFTFNAHAIGVNVDYVYSGSPGNYVLDFTVYNNIADPPNPHSIYAWGVDLASSGMSIPTDWYIGSSYNTAGAGGWDITYPSTWKMTNLGLPNAIYPGNSLSGFTLNYPENSLPGTIHFFAFGHDSSAYVIEEGDSSFIQFINNPGFQGIACASQVPEPATIFLLSSGFVGLAGLRRKLIA